MTSYRKPSTVRPSAISFLGACAILLSASAAAQQASEGVYRIPYADGTRVFVTNDHIRHDPRGRIDMSGRGNRGGSNYRIVAAADGTVRSIVDNFSARLDCSPDVGPAPAQENNYVWIEHDNGEWTKYTHMKQGTSTGAANLTVGQVVKAGTYLGDEGDVGCATGDHLHFEVGVPRETNGFVTTGGFLRDNENSKRNRIPRICGIGGGRFASDKEYKARKVPGNLRPGSREVARHGVPISDYQCLADQAANADYEMVWIDGFDVGGKVYFNVVLQPRSGPWQAFHGMSAAQHQKRFSEYVGKGYRPMLLESYNSGQGIRYAAIYRKQSGPQYKAYHGLSAGEHQKRMDDLTASGYRPRNVSVVSSGGQRSYTALYEKEDIGGWQARSALTADEYQKAFEDNAKRGRQLVYLNAYTHDAKPYFSAIWSSKAVGPYKARHGLTSSQYQSEWQGASRGGLTTRAVTGYSAGGSIRYAGIWRK